MYSVLDRLLKLTKQLFPTGRAFRISDNSTKEKVTKALLYSEERFYNDSVGILNSILPDNDFFTAEDATRWEERLGMIIGVGVPLQDRKDAIIRKMNHPGTVLARQSAGYLQNQLQLAGFDVYVYENIPAQTPIDVFTSSVSGIAEHSLTVEHMQTGMEHGNQYLWPNIVANSILQNEDQYFDFGTLRRTFFVCGSSLGTFANVLSVREQELRQLILKIKPAQTVAILGINYI